jgi:hypothetical protein
VGLSAVLIRLDGAQWRNHHQPYVDLSASYDLTDDLKLIFEAQNLTDEQNRLFIDSVREDTCLNCATAAPSPSALITSTDLPLPEVLQPPRFIRGVF